MTQERTQIEVVFFDVGGVLCADVIDEKLTDLSKNYGLPPGKLLDLKPALRLQADLGEIDEDQFWSRILAEAGLRARPDDLLFENYLVAVPGSLELAVRLGRRLRLAILSNDSATMSRARRDMFGFDDIFDPIVISSHVGLVKPDARIYSLAAKRAGVACDSCLFIDNTCENVDAARASGMPALHFQDAARLEDDLSRLGLLEDD
ncbi:MAG TPA: HAD family phosphatase [Myxococcota bacterium]|nr:HAD family phosphatase [Myxococcota bacterium]